MRTLIGETETEWIYEDDGLPWVEPLAQVTPLALPYPQENTPTSQAGNMLVPWEVETRLRFLEVEEQTGLISTTVNLPANVNLPSNGLVTLFTMNAPAAGTYYVFAQMTISGAAAPGLAQLRWSGQRFFTQWIPDAHPYTLQVEGIATGITAGQVGFVTILADSSNNLGACTVLQYDPVNQNIPVTYASYIQLAPI